MHFLKALSFAMGAAALSVTSPTEGSSVSQSGALSITWSTVSTDSQEFNIELALSTDAGNQRTLTTNVSPSTGSYSTAASAFTPGNYTINLVGNTATSSGILAQSKWFLITASSSSSSARGSAVASSTTAAGGAGAGAGATSTAASATSAARQSGSAVSSGASAGSSGAAATTATKSTSGAGRNMMGVAGSALAGFVALVL